MKGFRHPATWIASMALFVALGGGAALASGLISGKKIVNHSIPAKKLIKSAVNALRGQRGPAGQTCTPCGTVEFTSPTEISTSTAPVHGWSKRSR